MGRKRTTEDIINHVKTLYGDEYILMIENDAKIYMDEKVNVKHEKCGTVFKPKIADFIRGHKCPKCFGKIRPSVEEFKKSIKTKTTDVYEYLENEYTNNKTKRLFQHMVCGSKFSVTPKDFLRGCRCPNCKTKSKAENIAYSFLSKLAKCERNKTFSDCKDRQVLHFDIYVEEKNCCVELDGIQHFDKTNYFWSEDVERHDIIKNDYCKKNNIKLIRIPYWDFDKIENILSNELKLRGGVCQI